MKGGVERPVRLIDITHIGGLDDITTLPGGGICIGALVRNSDAANHALVREQYPLLSQAFLSGASAQLRNMATVGGNLLQRTRCGYFYDTAFSQCNKRTPGSGCAALESHNRMRDSRRESPVRRGESVGYERRARGTRRCRARKWADWRAKRIPIAEFHRLPGDRPDVDTTLRPGELITAIDLPPPLFSAHSHYLKVRDRASYAFALVSVAAALQMDGERVQTARIALGGVAHKPGERAPPSSY